MSAQRSTITRWHFVRHAPVDQSGPAPRSVLYATPDEPADCSDTPQFEALAGFLPVGGLWVTSQLKRAQQTADAILHHHVAPPKARWIDARLAEQHYGDWHGLTLDALQAELAGRPFHKMWITTAEDAPPNGETFHDLAERVRAAMDDITAAHAGANIVAVAHGGTIRAALAYALGLELNRALTVSVENLSTTRIDHVPGPGIGGDWRVVYVNRRPAG
jgi:broad specificity phosphatase PhoE